jgi:hypothetical protein
MTGDSFPDSCFSATEFETGNPYLIEKGDFVIGSNDHRLVFCDGMAAASRTPSRGRVE